MPSLTPYVSPQKGALIVNKPGFNNMADLANIIRNLNFDQNYFITRRFANGLSVSVRPSENANDFNGEFHFKVESNTTSGILTDVIVRGGYWIRDGIPVPAVCDDGKYTGVYDSNVFSMTISNAAPQYINAYLDTSSGTVSFSNSASMATGSTDLTIAWINTNTSSFEINQYLVGDVVDNSEADHSWHFVQTSNTGGTVTLGHCYLGGIDYSVNSWSAVISGVTVDTDFWIELHRDGTASTMFYWKHGAAGTEPASTDKLEAIPVLEFITSGGIITSVIERVQSDIRITLFG